MVFSVSMQRLFTRASTALTIGVLAIGCSSGSGSTDEPPAGDASTDATASDTGISTDAGSDASDSGADTATDTGPAGCKTNADCATDAKGKFCLTAGDAGAGTCVPCLPGASDSCGTGTYCSGTSYTCETGCKTTADCVTTGGDAGTADDAGDAGDAGPTKLTCDTTKHTCVGCVADDDCPLGSVCDATSSACVAGCNPKHPCAPGKECCGTSCFDTQKDVNNCGTCGKVCSTPTNGTAACKAGVCGIDKCDTGYGNCDGDDTNGCETNTTSNTDNCGGCGVKCGLANATNACISSTCTISACATGFANCDMDPLNGCEVPTTTLTDCGGCGTVCSRANGVASCATGTCQLTSCLSGYGDCDGNGANGCETNTNTGSVDSSGNIVNCGGCGAAGKTCSVSNGLPACAAGICGVLSCSATYANCNGNYTDGCEIRTSNDVNNCGACAKKCATNNGTASCITSTCAIACNPGYGDCVADVATTASTLGCETNLTNTTAHCGACGAACTGKANTTAVKCAPSGTTGSCAVDTCATGYYDNNGTFADGCECLADTVANACSSTLPTTNVVVGASGSSASVFSGNLAEPTDEDWYKITFGTSVDCSFSPKIVLDDSAAVGLVKMQIFTNTCPGTTPTGQTCDAVGGEPANSTAAAGFTTWDYRASKPCADDLTLNGIDPTTANTGSGTLAYISLPTTVYVKVFRSATVSGSCRPYKLTVTNKL